MFEKHKQRRGQICFGPSERASERKTAECGATHSSTHAEQERQGEDEEGRGSTSYESAENSHTLLHLRDELTEPWKTTTAADLFWNIETHKWIRSRSPQAP